MIIRTCNSYNEIDLDALFIRMKEDHTQNGQFMSFETAPSPPKKQAQHAKMAAFPRKHAEPAEELQLLQPSHPAPRPN
ncbi:hypothetical protein BC351_15260 [Paenibacillus ferrarius]|uniref:Uncharacterized protein n=1 Tax=Paenibacillus ferrarius TaxID=1469647 RepID=A0A1V4HRL0_9BACL|nr:hypothetical protein [Paenibacillus ferrarius]OPH61295.1 hypothetical protein BC351_15260 [Paenibacillus ferrarius]